MRIVINYSRTSWYGHLSNKDTSMLRTVSNVPTKFAYIFFKKKPPLYGLSLIQTKDTRSWPQSFI